MVVQHNLSAMNANRMLGITTKALSKSTEKLSSGYKVNRAADDAAGLSISEKMRKQIRGLKQASLNAEDGISCVQTAEGALAEVHDMLQRMNELAVKSSNETNSESDRKSIQDEINQLTTEIDRVAKTTKFNEIYLLQGDSKGKVKVAADAKIDNIKFTTVSLSSAVSGAKVEIAKGTELNAGTLTLGKLTATADKGSLDLNALSGTLEEYLRGEDETLTVKAEADGKWSITPTGGTKAIYTEQQLKEWGLNLAGVSSDVTITKSIELAEGLPDGVKVTLPAAGALKSKNIKIGQTLDVTVTNDSEGAAKLTDYDPTYVPATLNIDLQVGADTSSSNKIRLSIESMSAASLGLVDLSGKLAVDGKDSTNADKAVNNIAIAIAKVSAQRSTLGAIQNRLEHTIKNLDNVVENTTAAESQIRDTDMASEMVKYSNTNILAQAGQSMLAQANQSNQGVLSLLG